MLSRLHRLPLVALLFLAGSPGLGGVALQAIHACRAELGATADQGGAAGHHGGHHDEAPEDEQCRCIGACQGALFTAPPRAIIVAWADMPPPAGPPAPGRIAIPPVGRGHHLLPPATAPPLS